MSERTIWQFGGGYICIEDGSEATPEEVEAFKARHAKLKEEGEARVKQAEEVDREWHEKYDEKILKYFSYDDDWGSKESFLRCYDGDDALVYQLSTRIFDCVPPEFYKKFPEAPALDTFLNYIEFGNHIRNSNYKFKEEMQEMKETFPDHYQDAILGFLDGNHDT